jgi:hypothetical protein
VAALALTLATALGLALPPPARAQDDVEDLLRQLSRQLQALGLGGSDLSPEALLAQELPAVEQAAGMRSKAAVPVRVVTREEAAAHVSHLFEEQVPPAREREMERAFRALGLLPRDRGLRASVESLYSQQAGGFYDAAKQDMVLLRDIPVALQVPVVRHELVHALQDQTWNLRTWLGDAALDEDRAAAVQAVLEGHATEVMNRMTLSAIGLDALAADPDFQELFGDMLGEAAGTGGGSGGSGSQGAGGGSGSGSGDLGLDPDLLAGLLPRDAPPFLLAQLLFPYVTGAAFVSGYREKHPEDPSCSALYKRPPLSSAEVLDPRRWERGFVPTLRQPGTFLPGWEPSWHSALGQLLARVALTGRGDPAAGDPRAARWDRADRDTDVVVGGGWRGDRVAVFAPLAEGPGTKMPDSRIVVWASHWRDAAEAREVARLLRERAPWAEVAPREARVDAVLEAPAGSGEAALRALRSWK